LVDINVEDVEDVEDVQLTLDRPSNMNVIQKPLSGLKNVLPKPHKAFGSGFTKLHAKLDADTLLDFAIHRRHNDTKSKAFI
jgi:hypothetical protein